MNLRLAGQEAVLTSTLLTAVESGPGGWWHYGRVLCFNTVFLVPVQLVPSMTVALKASHGVLASMLTASIVQTAFVYISAMGEAIESEALVAHTLEATR